MDEPAKQKNTKAGRLIALALFVLALLILALGVRLFTLRVDERRYFCLDTLDLRGKTVSCEDYEDAAARRPGLTIRWDVPIGDGRYDSLSGAVTAASCSPLST